MWRDDLRGRPHYHHGVGSLAVDAAATDALGRVLPFLMAAHNPAAGAMARDDPASSGAASASSISRSAGT
jgi:hypothetical protein